MEMQSRSGGYKCSMPVHMEDYVLLMTFGRNLIFINVR
jgi:hypothetical protein